MNAFALHAPPDQSGAFRWTGSALVIVAAHLALIFAGAAWYTQSSPPGVTIPAILVDMSPAPAAPATQAMDVAPGPEMQQADTPTSPPPEPMQQQVVEEIAPTPPLLKPEVEAPPEQKTPPTPPKPEPAKIIPDRPKPTPVKQKPVRAEAKQVSEQPPAPRTSAAPKAERQAVTMSGAPAGATAAVRADYGRLLNAHLQRFKQYPAAAQAAGQRGAATVIFTVSRSGQVLSKRLAGTSGFPSLDAEALATLSRAQPLPSFPPEMTESSRSFDVRIRFN